MKSSNVWLRVQHEARGDVWVRGDEVIAVGIAHHERYRDKADEYGIKVTWFRHDRTTHEVARGFASRSEAMSAVRQLVQLLADPDQVGLISLEEGSVAFEALGS